MDQINRSPAAAITKAASKQTYYTIRFLVDRERAEDAYRAYAYFRWMDDILDAHLDPASLLRGSEASERRTFLERQKSLIESCYRGVFPHDVTIEESMLIELVKHDHEKNSGLQAYLRNMMLVMDFDARRRGRLVSQTELDRYTYWLASAVTEAMHYFIGHAAFVPRDDTQYLAASAAHIIHMLRDTYEDMQEGYYNIPREVLEAYHIKPRDVHSQAYCLWVRSRVGLAQEYFEAGKDYFARTQNPRHRLAGFAYIARFEWLIDTLKTEGYSLRARYDERRSIGTGLRMSWLALSSMVNMRGVGALPRSTVSQRAEKP